VQGADGIGTSELLYYNAITSLPVLATMVTLSGDATRLPAVFAASAAMHGTGLVVGCIVLSSVAGCLLNYALFLCVIHNSALTTTIVGVLKGVVAVVAGLLVMNKAPISAVNLMGIGLNTTGGVW
jgi:solute carrier family 35 protein